ncbi:hypothetical protein [Actinoallomurus iriomotensis]|uniref:Outer membrane channel protein CpnT-like N-terminal domain-containing protein n=1 Tax=Actinoallomurus iriomotensis TaxID=478107 RepID=A0A9W6SAB7_9ACTN|nr:hypothetical protein [Actinoallomurus iriomotensis]GLY89943.1 hypothetical protein Airi02_078720 [Actinoallomurus iriomotensis]
MAIELPGWFAKLLNLMGIAGAAGWTNANEDTAHAVGTVYQQHATNVQPAVTDAKTHGQRATSAVQSAAGTSMTQTIDHPQGAINNLVDHHKGALVTALIAGGVVPIGLASYKIFKLVDGGVTAAQIATSAMIPGGQLAIPEELAIGRLLQTGITNTLLGLLLGGSDTKSA